MLSRKITGLKEHGVEFLCVLLCHFPMLLCPLELYMYMYIHMYA